MTFTPVPSAITPNQPGRFGTLLDRSGSGILIRRPRITAASTSKASTSLHKNGDKTVPLWPRFGQEESEEATAEKDQAIDHFGDRSVCFLCLLSTRGIDESSACCYSIRPKPCAVSSALRLLFPPPPSTMNPIQKKSAAVERATNQRNKE